MARLKRTTLRTPKRSLDTTTTHCEYYVSEPPHHTLTDACVTSILSQISGGCTVKAACKAESVKYKTFLHWMHVDPELRAGLEARAEALRS